MYRQVSLCSGEKHAFYWSKFALHVMLHIQTNIPFMYILYMSVLWSWALPCVQETVMWQVFVNYVFQSINFHAYKPTINGAIRMSKMKLIFCDFIRTQPTSCRHVSTLVQSCPSWGIHLLQHCFTYMSSYNLYHVHVNKLYLIFSVCLGFVLVPFSGHIATVYYNDKF